MAADTQGALIKASVARRPCQGLNIQTAALAPRQARRGDSADDCLIKAEGRQGGKDNNPSRHRNTSDTEVAVQFEDVFSQTGTH